MARQKKTGTPFQSLVQRISAIYLEGMRDLSPENYNRRTMEMHWNAGRQIVEEEQNGKDAAPYGTALLKELANILSTELGRSVSDRQLTYERKFYSEYEISHICAKLTWSHYKALLEVRPKKERTRLERLAIKQNLSNTALRKLVREFNRYKSLGETMAPAIPSLVPREGRINLVKVVRLAGLERDTLALDCGFRAIEPLPRYAPKRITPNALLEVISEKNDNRLAVVRCAPGERYCFDGTVQSVIDGDTIAAYLKLCFGRGTLQNLRLRGVYAPELGTAAGRDARVELEALLPPGTPIRVHTYHWDMYGRYISDLFAGGPSGLFVNQALIQKILG